MCEACSKSAGPGHQLPGRMHRSVDEKMHKNITKGAKFLCAQSMMLLLTSLTFA